MSEDECFYMPGKEIMAYSGYEEIGPGCYVEDGTIFASVVGKLKVERSGEYRCTVSVVRGNARAKTNLVPAVGDVVTCRILRVNPRMAQAEILLVDGKPVQGVSFRAVIRKENVRQTEVDKVQMADSFRPGDIVLAKVAALGSARSFELSTAEETLGVVSKLG